MSTPEDVPVGPLSDTELDRMQSLLRGFGAGAMNLARLDGFLAALVCTSDLLMPEDCLDLITGIEQDDSDDPPPIDAATEEFLDLATRHWDDIAATLERGEPVEPLLDRDEHGQPRGRDWAAGFLQGVKLDGDLWSSIVDDDERCAALLPIFALAHEHDPDPGMRPAPIDDAHRNDLILGALAGVLSSHRDLAKRRRADAKSAREVDTVRYVEPKVGRNDPCPCGSGKKYKQCHGKLA
jgi:uncharacterized protein